MSDIDDPGDWHSNSAPFFPGWSVRGAFATLSRYSQSADPQDQIISRLIDRLGTLTPEEAEALGDHLKGPARVAVRRSGYDDSAAIREYGRRVVDGEKKSAVLADIGRRIHAAGQASSPEQAAKRIERKAPKISFVRGVLEGED